MPGLTFVFAQVEGSDEVIREALSQVGAHLAARMAPPAVGTLLPSAARPLPALPSPAVDELDDGDTVISTERLESGPARLDDDDPAELKAAVDRLATLAAPAKPRRGRPKTKTRRAPPQVDTRRQGQASRPSAQGRAAGGGGRGQ